GCGSTAPAEGPHGWSCCRSPTGWPTSSASPGPRCPAWPSARTPRSPRCAKPSSASSSPASWNSSTTWWARNAARSTACRSPPKRSPRRCASSGRKRAARRCRTSPSALPSSGCRPCGGTESARVRCRNPPRGSGNRQYRKPAGPGGNRHSGLRATGTRNRSGPNLNRRYGSGGAAVTSAAEWQGDPATHAWARQQGHLDRLGEQGLQAADAKWRAHRAGHAPRPAEAWAADWRAWITREHAPSRPNLYAVPGQNSAAPGGMTRAEKHTAALLAALDEPTGTEG